MNVIARRGTPSLRTAGFAFTATDSDGGSASSTGALVISSGGVVTLAGVPGFRGVMDARKRIIVGTETWTTGSPGTTQLTILTRMTKGAAQ